MRATRRDRPLRLILVSLLSVLLGGTAYRAILGQAATVLAQGPGAGRSLDAVQVEYHKTLASLKAALPKDDTKLQQLIQLQAEKEKLLMDRLELALAEREKVVAELKTERDEAKADLVRNMRDAEARFRKLQERIAPIDLLAFDQPKGTIVEVEKGQQTVHLNLGRADSVRRGLTFSVFGDGELQGERGAQGQRRGGRGHRRASVPGPRDRDQECRAPPARRWRPALQPSVGAGDA